MKVSCVNCKELFEIGPKIEEQEKGLQYHYFECPNCLERYTIRYSNVITRELQEKLTQTDISSKGKLYKQYQEEYKKINK